MCVQGLSFRLTFVSCTHISARCRSSSVFVTAEFQCVPVDGRVSWSQCWVTTNNVGGDFLVCAFWCVYMRGFARSLPRSAIVGYVHLQVQDTSAFPRGCPTSESLPSGGRHVPPHRVSAALHSVDHFHSSQSVGCVDAGHCGLNLHFPDGLGGRSLFTWWEAVFEVGPPVSASLFH